MTNTACDLASKSCRPCEGGVTPLARVEIDALIKQVSGWEYRDGVITKTHSFKNHYQTMAFVNAVAWVSHREDHHPDLKVGYNRCVVEYSTHAIKGLSENDFICAAKIDALFNI